MEYFLLINENERGPFTLDELKTMWMSGQIARDTLFYHKELGDWKTIGCFVENEIQKNKGECPPPLPKPTSLVSRRLPTISIAVLVLGVLAIVVAISLGEIERGRGPFRDGYNLGYVIASSEISKSRIRTSETIENAADLEAERLNFNPEAKAAFCRGFVKGYQKGFLGD